MTALRLKLKIAVASSGTCDWVMGHLKLCGLLHYFSCIKCADDVQKVKPDPALYLAALADLQVKPEQAIALEDSPDAILAAKQAGLFCVAVPIS